MIKISVASKSTRPLQKSQKESKNPVFKSVIDENLSWNQSWT